MYSVPGRTQAPKHAARARPAKVNDIDPLHIEFLETGTFRIVRQVLLGVGVLMLFLEYILPGTRVFKIAGKDDSGLRLLNRKK